MSINYLTGALLALLGGFVVVVSQAFSAHVVGWVAFGIGAAVIAIMVLAQLDRMRGWVQRGLDGATVAVSSLMVAFALAESGSAVTWLSFAFALGFVVLAFAGLTVHEVADRTEQRDLGQIHGLTGVHAAPATSEGSPSQAA